MVTEDLSHKSHKLNPRKHPIGFKYSDNSKSKLPSNIGGMAMLSEDERCFIHDIPRLLGHGNYANLGHAEGGSAILMADSLRENFLPGKVYSIDLFNSNKQIRRALNYIDIYEVDQWIELCFGSTKDWAEKLDMVEFNFIFVDADHTYEAVKADILNWAPKVKIDGWMAMHDTNQDFSHQAIVDSICNFENWEELKEFHIDRIRTFRRIS